MLLAGMGAWQVTKQQKQANASLFDRRKQERVNNAASTEMTMMRRNEEANSLLASDTINSTTESSNGNGLDIV
jgi:hypothetical protein